MFKSIKFIYSLNTVFCKNRRLFTPSKGEHSAIGHRSKVAWPQSDCKPELKKD